MSSNKLIVIVVAIAAVANARAADDQRSCAQIAAACQRAGFVRGGATAGEGLIADCIRPILQGTAQPPKASKPLPRVDAKLVAACRAENPALGRAKGGASERESPSLAKQPPPAGDASSSQSRAVPDRATRPNIVFVLTDDLAWNLVQFMPHVLAMQKAGVSFTNYFVTDSLCCPSRASIFTGRYPHNTGVFRNTGNDGGYLVFRDRGHEEATFATSLSAAGYRTALLGKYLNGYLPAKHRPAPGWSFWAVGGNAYPEFNYNLNQDGRILHYGASPADYLTDVLSDLAVRFINQAGNAPFLIEVATYAPHEPYTPAPRDAGALPGLHAPRTPAFDAAPQADTPKWLHAQRALSALDVARIDFDFRKRAQSVLAVDKMIGALQAAIAAIGQTNNTYFIFSSDNGYHMGEHRLMPGKMTAFDTDIHVPLIITGPSIRAGLTVEEIVENIDLCPTFTELGGAEAPANVDGRSLVPLLRGQKVADWRTVALVEHRGPNDDPIDPDAPGARSGNPTTYEAIRGRTSVYVEYANGEKEYHDLTTDPHELRNSFASLPARSKSSLHETLEAAKNCRDVRNCTKAERK
jgi:N-acetylglucosamine-6-sulfatase